MAQYYPRSSSKASMTSSFIDGGNLAVTPSRVCDARSWPNHLFVKPLPPAVNPNCTALSLITSPNGKVVTWFVTSPPTDNRPQPKEALPTVSQL
jgi:hypothetical protein